MTKQNPALALLIRFLILSLCFILPPLSPMQPKVQTNRMAPVSVSLYLPFIAKVY